MDHSIRFSERPDYLFKFDPNYKISRSINTESRHTYRDWFLIPKERYSIANAEPKTQIIEIPGANGGLDVSESLTGYPLFGYREGSFDFIIDNQRPQWEKLWRDIVTYLHGKERYMMLEDDPQWVYHGRFTVGQYTADKNYSTIQISYKLNPYKQFAINDNFVEQSDGTFGKDVWYWDAMDMNEGKITDFTDLSRKEIKIDSSSFIRIQNLVCGQEPVVPTIHVKRDNDDPITLWVRNSILNFDYEIELTPSADDNPYDFYFYDRRIVLVSLTPLADIHLMAWGNDTTVYAKGHGELTFIYDLGVL